MRISGILTWTTPRHRLRFGLRKSIREKLPGLSRWIDARGAGFSLWRLVLGRTKPRRLPFRTAQGKKPAPPHSHFIFVGGFIGRRYRLWLPSFNSRKNRKESMKTN